MTKMFGHKLFSIVVVILLKTQIISMTEMPEWSDHDISTLKLLQIVHRHGERTVLKSNMPKTDPFKDVDQYWAEGLGQLTNHGKYRMYAIGQYLRQSYQTYLGDEHSPREVYARSSIEPRCIESLSCLLSGMYPPKNEWTWNNSDGQPELAYIWQPFPIETFMPKDDDTLLVPHKKCPKATEEHNKISNSAKVKKIVDNFKKQNISKYLNNLFEDPIDSLYRGQQYWDTLTIEAERGLIWPQLNGSGPYTQQEVLDSLNPLAVGSYVEDWNTDFIRTIRLGKLIETLIKNMKNKIDGLKTNFDRKLYAYSTHDTIVCPLLQALGIYNELYPPYGASILIELHGQQGVNRDDHQIRIYYYNETLRNQPYLLMRQTFDEFESKNKKFYYDDFDTMCGIKSDDNLVLVEMTFLVIGIGIGIGLLGLNILAIQFIRSRRRFLSVTK